MNLKKTNKKIITNGMNTEMPISVCHKLIGPSTLFQRKQHL